MIYNFLKGSNYNKLNQKNNYLNKCISEKINHNQLIFKNSQYVYFWWENWKMVGKNSLLFNRFLIKKIEVFLTQKQYNLKSMKNDIKQLFFEINIVLYLVIYQMFLKRLLRSHFWCKWIEKRKFPNIRDWFYRFEIKILLNIKIILWKLLKYNIFCINMNK